MPTKQLSMSRRNIRRRELRAERKQQGMTRRNSRLNSMRRTPPELITRVPKTIKNHFVLVRDGSGSMAGHASAASKLFRDQIRTLDGTKGQESRISVYDFGCGGATREREFSAPTFGRSFAHLDPYPCSGPSTPLYDGVLDAIRGAQRDVDPDVSFCMIVLTDGQENASSHTAHDLREKIVALQATDRWTFVFLVPPGYKNAFVAKSGVHEGNVREWSDARQASVELTAGTVAYTQARAAGRRSVQTYFTDASNITTLDLRNLKDVTGQVEVYLVSKEDRIQPFIEQKRRHFRPSFTPGNAFYELMKREDEVQDYKKLLLLDKAEGKMYADGAHLTVRGLLGLPDLGTIKIDPGNHANYVVFVESRSVNRILPRGTRVAYWDR